jgi:predicted  nucleic acid-binding Zn-ribbon protein
MPPDEYACTGKKHVTAALAVHKSGVLPLSCLLCCSAAERYAQAHQQLEVLLQQRLSMEDAVQAAQQQLHQISSRMEDVQQQIAERTDQLQGSVLLQKQRSAVTSLRDEIQQMELRLGLLAHQLVQCKQQQADRQRQRDQQLKRMPAGMP